MPQYAARRKAARRLVRAYARWVAERNLSGRRLGEYLLGARIDSGGYGVVYSAEQVPLRRQCVVKVLLEDRMYNSNKARSRFRLEAELASRLDHPYAARVLTCGCESDIDADGEIVWIAMERVQGDNLADWLTKNGPMSLERFVPFFEALCDVVQYAHDLGIVHRDIKPSNIMVMEKAGRILPKLLDLGIAKPVLAELVDDVAQVVSGRRKPSKTPRTVAMRPNARRQTRTWRSSEASSSSRRRAKEWRLTTPGSRMGSWPYMPPEQWGDARAVGPSADLYALGILAYEVLTGTLPFHGETIDEYWHCHKNEPVPPIGSPQLDPIFTRALAKTPAGRQCSVKELANEFNVALRAIEREHVRSAAQTWIDRGRPSRLLLSKGMLADFERARAQNARILTDLEYEFIEASQRRAGRITWMWRACMALLIVGVVGVVQYRSSVNARLADVTATQSALEQGRAALLHGEADAESLLAEAYRRGEHSPSTKFMLARAIQPRLAEQARFASTFGRMWSADYSPDGRHVITTDDKGVQLWDAQTDRLVFAIPQPDTAYQAVFTRTGESFAVPVGDGAVRVWSTANGTLLREFRYNEAKPRYTSVALSLDGQFVAAIDRLGSVAHVWNANTGSPVTEVHLDGHGVPSIAFSYDSQWLAISGGGSLRVIDTKNWGPVPTIGDEPISSLAFDPTGPRLLAGSATGDITIWDIPNGTRLHHLRDTGEPIEAVAFSRDGAFVTAASRDGSQQVWSADGHAVSQFDHRHSKILAVEFDRTSKLVLAASSDGSVAVTNVELGLAVAVLEGPTSVVLTAHFDPTSAHVIGASWDGTARIWDATSPYGRWSVAPISDNCGTVTGAEPDGRFVAASCGEHGTRIWDTANGRLLAELPTVTDVPGDFTSASPAVSKMGDRAAIARGNWVEIYDVPSRKLLKKVVHEAPVNAVAFGPSGRDLVSGAIDGSLIVTRDNGSQLRLPRSNGGIDAAEILPDGRVISSDAQRRLKVYDSTGASLADLELTSRAMSLRCQGGSRLITVPIYTASAASPVLIDLARYQIVAQLNGHVGRVFSARWVAPDRVLTAGGDGTARMWDGLTGELRRTYRGGTRFLADATVSADGQVVVGGDGDGKLRFWDLNSGLPIWMMQAHKSHLIGLRVEGDDIVTRGFGGEVSRWSLPRAEQVFGACGTRAGCAIIQP